MRDLERELRALDVKWPETPDMAAAVRARLEPQAPPRRPALTRRRIAAALVALLLGGVAAVEPARSAVLELLGLKSVKIERREPTAPVRPPGADLGRGRPVTQADAERLARGYRPRPPAALGEPDAVFFSDGPPARGNVSYTYRPRPGLPGSATTGVGLLVTEFPATVRPFVEKTLGAGARLKTFRIDGDLAYFISGARHGVGLMDPEGNEAFVEDQRLAGNTLLVERGGLLIRIEGEISRTRATAIARSIPR